MLGAAAAYVTINASGGDLRGWAIPIATDIAFALGVLGLVGRRAPQPLRAFMLTLAVVDDLGTIVSSRSSSPPTCRGAGSRPRARSCWSSRRRSGGPGCAIAVYIVLAAAVWLAVFESGVHATVAGVALGFLTPAVAGRSRDDAAGRSPRI